MKSKEKIEKIAKSIIGFKITEKKDFLDFLQTTIKNIYFIVDSKIITAASLDPEIEFLNLKSKIAKWSSEQSHHEPFYPREFIKRILKGNGIIN